MHAHQCLLHVVTRAHVMHAESLNERVVREATGCPHSHYFAHAMLLHRDCDSPTRRPGSSIRLGTKNTHVTHHQIIYVFAVFLPAFKMHLAYDSNDFIRDYVI